MILLQHDVSVPKLLSMIFFVLLVRYALYIIINEYNFKSDCKSINDDYNCVTYTDIDECLTNNGGCSADASCSNTVGSFTCICQSGYTGDGFTCSGK